MKFTTILDRDDGPLEVEITGSFEEESFGYRNTLGVPEEPDEKAFFCIEDVRDGLGNRIALTPEEENSILHELYERAGDNRPEED